MRCPNRQLQLPPPAVLRWMICTVDDTERIRMTQCT